MRTLLVVMLATSLGAVALAQEAFPLRDNPKLFIQPEEPPYPTPTPPPPVVVQEAQPCQPCPPQAVQPPAETLRENVAGREEKPDEHQRLFDQWNAPHQKKGGYAHITLR